MSNKPWKDEIDGPKLEAFLGSRGFRTSLFLETKDLIRAAAMVFEIDPAGTCAEMASQIGALSVKQRAQLCKRHFPALWAQYGESGVPAAGGRPILEGLADELGWRTDDLERALRRVLAN